MNAAQMNIDLKIHHERGQCGVPVFSPASVASELLMMFSYVT